MNTRTARLLRLGILAARDAERMKHIRAAHPVVRAGARREEVRIEDRELKAKLTAMKAERDPDDWGGYSMPQRVLIGIDPATITAEQAEHLRRFYA